MDRGIPSRGAGRKARSRRGRGAWASVLLLLAAAPAAAQDVEGRPIFDWDLVSLEQNSQRFNGSVLSGFHNIRSAGVTPRRAWKAGLGIIYSKEDQVATGGGTESTVKFETPDQFPRLPVLSRALTCHVWAPCPRTEL